MAEYRPHQRRFIDTEIRFPRSPGKIIDHEVGSGKTLTVIGAVEALRIHEAFREAPVVVLTMKALVEGFYHELSKSEAFVHGHLPDGTPLKTRRDLYTVTTYQSFYQGPSRFRYQQGILIVDEAHCFRNPKSKKYRVLFQVCKSVRKVYLLTGTVVVNYSVDVAPLINLILSDRVRQKIRPDVLHPDRAGYLPVTRHDWDQLHTRYPDVIARYLCCLVSHFREDRDSVEYKSHFPVVERYDIRVALTEEHYRAYQQLMKDETNPKRPKLFKREINADLTYTADDIREYQSRIARGAQLSDTKDTKFLAWVMRLRMACNQQVGADGVEYMPKLSMVALKIIAGYRADPTYKATLTTVFIRRGIRLVQSLLRHNHIQFVTITGQSDDVKDSRDIQRAVQAYNSGAVRIMLFSSAGQHGLDLHGTTEAFTINPHWHKAYERQAEARVVRYDGHKGHTHPTVKIYRVIATLPPGREGRTADEFLHELGLKKDEENQRITALIPHHCCEAAGVQYLAEHLPFFYNRHTPLQPVIPVASVASLVSMDPVVLKRHLPPDSADSGTCAPLSQRRRILKRKW